MAESVRRSWWKIAIMAVVLIELAGGASGWLSNSGYGNGWFDRLEKPGFMPPGWAFPVAWSILYILMGLALAIVINARGSRRRVPALIVFGIQLMLNLAWTPVFFGMHRIVPALVIIGSLVVLVAITIALFWQVRRTAGLLLLPYLAWICFAFVLLYQIHVLNPDAQTLVPSRMTDQIEIR